MFPCPRCHTPLKGQRGALGIHYMCPSCSGQAANVSLLRRELADSFMDRLWIAVLDAPQAARSTEVDCPSCSRKMVEVNVEVEEGAPFVLDVCRHCQFLWMDGGEYERLPASSERERARTLDERIPLETRQKLAIAEVQGMQRREEEEQARSTGPPEEFWKTVVTIFGFPVEENEPVTRQWPVVTWTVAALCVVATLLAHLSGSPDQVFQHFGFTPGDLGRFALGRALLTSVTSFFLHGGVMHLLGNLWFLLLVGNNVEDALGKGRFLLLLVISTMLGDMSHWLLDPHSEIPLIGASGGISGLMMFYALRFPKTRLVFWLLYFWWIRLSVRWAMVLWVLLQVFAATAQWSGNSGSVSSLAHLGGAFGGLLFWWVAKHWEPGSPRQERESQPLWERAQERVQAQQAQRARRAQEQLRKQEQAHAQASRRTSRDEEESSAASQARKSVTRTREKEKQKDSRREGSFFGRSWSKRKRRRRGDSSRREAVDLWGERGKTRR